MALFGVKNNYPIIPLKKQWDIKKTGLHGRNLPWIILGNPQSRGMWDQHDRSISNSAPADQQWSIRILVPPLRGLSLHAEMLNWFWHLHDDFVKFISLVFLFHWLSQLSLHHSHPGCFIHHVCFAFTIALFLRLTPVIKPFPSSLPSRWIFFFCLMNKKKDVLFLTWKTEFKKHPVWHNGRIWVLTAGLRGGSWLIWCVSSSTTYVSSIWHCCTFQTSLKSTERQPRYGIWDESEAAIIMKRVIHDTLALNWFSKGSF